ncbi:MAG: putative alpha/beta superfamily hydrolase [Saprospiraceae bacterium]|jgi:predicted alpha/beta superfamily hydrolase
MGLCARRAEDPEKRFLALYLLDRTAHFYSATGMLHQLSIANEYTLTHEMIVVAIPTSNKTRDLTPSAISYMRNSGGAENFTTFIEKELIPYIDKKHPTTPYRTILDHSCDGLLIVNILIHYTELFDNFIPIDHTILWNNLSLKKRSKSTIRK